MDSASGAPRRVSEVSAVFVDTVFTAGGQHEIVELHNINAGYEDDSLLVLAGVEDDVPHVIVRSSDGKTALVILWAEDSK